MISDDDLYRLAIFLGSCAMMMIVLYHFLDINASDEEADSAKTGESAKVAGSVASPSAESAGASAAAYDGTVWFDLNLIFIHPKGRHLLNDRNPVQKPARFGGMVHWLGKDQVASPDTKKRREAVAS